MLSPPSLDETSRSDGERRSAGGAAKALVKQSFWILLGRLVGALVQAGSMAILARWSGPTAFGYFAAAYGVAIMLQAATDFGLNTYLIRMRARYPAATIVGGLLKLQTRINWITAAAGVLVGTLISIWNPSLIALVPIAIWMACDKQVEAWLCIPLSDGRAWQNAISLVSRRVGALSILILAAWLDMDPILGYSIGLAVSSLGSAIVLRHRNMPYVNGWKQTLNFRTTFKSSFQYWVNSLATQLRNLDTVIVGVVLGAGAAGYYGAAARLTTPLRMVPTSFAAVLMPVAAKTNGNDRSVSKSIALLLVVSTVFYTAIAITIPFVVPFVLGEEYRNSIPVIQVVCVGLIFASISSQFNALLQGWGYPKAVAAVSVISTFFCLVGVAVAPIFAGVLGAGIALSISYVVQTALLVIMLRFVRRREHGKSVL